MKFYTKEWYELMQRQHYTSGLKKVPDKVYADEDIQAFYDKDLKAEATRPPNHMGREACCGFCGLGLPLL